MRLDITDTPPPAARWKRLAWFAAIWALSVAALGGVAYGIRVGIKA